MSTNKLVIKKIRVFFLILIGFVLTVFASYYFYQYSQKSRASSDKNISLEFINSPINISKNGSGYVEVHMRSGTNKVSIASILVRFPKNLIVLDSSHADDGCKDLPNIADSRVIEGKSDEIFNTAIITRLITTSNENLPKGLICFGRIYFKGAQNGSGQVTFAPADTILNNNWKWDIAGPDAGNFVPKFDVGTQEISLTVADEPPVTITSTPTITPTPPLCMGVQHCTNGVSTEAEYCGDCKGLGCNPAGYTCSQVGFTCKTYAEKVFFFDELYSVPCNLLPTLTPTPSPTVTITPTKTPTPTPTVTGLPIDNARLNFRIKFQGITTKPKNGQNLDVRVGLYKGGKEVATKQSSFSVQDDGTYVSDITYPKLEDGADYHALIKGPKHLQKKICTNSPTESFGGEYQCKKSQIVINSGVTALDFSGIYMLSGDIPAQNNIIDSADIVYIRSNIGSQNADVIARGDLNYDGIVDSQDYALVIKALSFKYDEGE